MKVIAVMTRKGGAGKTALTRALISGAASEGRVCLGIDADPQRALGRWFDRLDHRNPLLSVIHAQTPSELGPLIDQADSAGETDFIFIDTMGAGGAWADEVAVQADHIVLPVMLSHTDYDIATDTFEWYRGLHARAEDPSALPKLSVVLSRVDRTPSKAMRTVAEKIVRTFPVVSDLFMERKQHIDVDSEGLLGDIAEARRADPSPLKRLHAKHFDEALLEAKDILTEILEAT